MKLLLGLLCVGSVAFALPITDFTLKTNAGGSLSLKQAMGKNKGIVILFVSVECPVSNGYNERIKALSNDLATKNIAVIGINSNHTETFEDMKKHALEKGFAFPVLKDDGNKIADQFGATRTPEAFLVNPALQVVYHGRIDDDSEGTNPKRSQDLLIAAEELSAGKKISKAETKFFGCSIKRR